MVPLVHRRAICEFTPAEREIYDKLAEIHAKRLFRNDPKTDKPVWNCRHYRMLLLISTWTGFYHIENKLKASDTAKLLKKDNLLSTIVGRYCAVNKTLDVPKVDDVEGQLRKLYFGAPKIRALKKLVRQVVVMDQKKMVIFTPLPAQQVLLYAILQALQIPSAVYGAHLNAQGQSKLQARFNNEETPPGTHWLLCYYLRWTKPTAPMPLGCISLETVGLTRVVQLRNQILPQKRSTISIIPQGKSHCGKLSTLLKARGTENSATCEHPFYSPKRASRPKV